jgi:hypothetical protein
MRKFPALAIVLAALSLGTCLNFVGIAIALQGVSAQASAGAAARARQCRLLPISIKLFADAHQRGVLTDSDIRLVTAGASTACSGRRAGG